MLFLMIAFSLSCEAGIFSDFSSESQPKQVVEKLLAMADVQINGTRPWDIQVKNDAFYARVLKDGSLGLGESYMDEWWDSEAVDQTLFRILRAQLDKAANYSWAMRWAFLKAKLFNLQDKKGSMLVIDQHYQLGNDLFQNMLDGLMTYSCGYWKNAKTLDEAQVAKYDLIARKLRLKEGMRVLDIGCGWGGFAKYIAENYGVQVVGITLSENQADYAREVVKGLPVEIRVQDYRDIDETFDRIVEIGMFEHVGPKNYRTFMEIVHRSLKDDGMLMLHTIGSNKPLAMGDPWLNRYIFPHGRLPSVAEIGQSVEGLFVMEDWHNFGIDYDTTAMTWFANFEKNWEKIQASYPAPFFRMWKYYLLSCAGSFRARHIQLWQVVLSKNGTLGGYDSVR
ncbi:MAG TPA: cyclopropane fatty acyl phospholipid synthase [Chlamydiales bacterium]|nr:cyclopropane fatty acyl phospholipid synthase [Chlamydiales bacterium]